MNILLTGANGFIGKRLLPRLLDAGHTVYAVVRDVGRFPENFASHPNLHLVEMDFLKPAENSALPADIDAAYYLIHSMASSIEDFKELETRAAGNFVKLLNATNARQVIYLGGIVNADSLSQHLTSRLNVEKILRSASASLTALRAGIIVGSGSASFEIIRDLVEKLPFMITPRWLKTKCQPIAVRNVIEYLIGVLGEQSMYGQTYDIGGPEILTYRKMLLDYAEVRGLRRTIITLPVMTPRLSSYWLYFVTSTSYKLAVNLVNSMKVDVICADDRIRNTIKVQLLDYKSAISLALDHVKNEQVASSWKDSFISGDIDYPISSRLEVPSSGCLEDTRQLEIHQDPAQVLRNIWAIGGERGWYYANWLWVLRGFVDKLVGGVGLRRGRTHKYSLSPGEALDFWRVVVADEIQRRLLLYAEMRIPGDAWLEFTIEEKQGRSFLRQKATFKPRGMWGRMYWYVLTPFHAFVFGGMIRNIERYGAF